MPLSTLALELGAQHNGLVLGCGNTPVEMIDPLVKTLAKLVADSARHHAATAPE